MARRVRKLHAAHRRGGELFRGNGFAHRRIYVHQYRYGGDRHRREMAGDRKDQAWALSSMGSLLFPLVAGEALPWTGPYQMVPEFPRHAALSDGARDENRQGRAHRRDRAGRGRSDLDWARREYRIERQFRQCAGRGKRTRYRHDRPRRRGLYRIVLRHRGKCRRRRGGRARRSDRDRRGWPRWGVGSLGWLAGAQGWHGGSRPAGPGAHGFPRTPRYHGTYVWGPASGDT